ncbi:MAG: hypothetical protein HY543_04440 [Deltaproteobacteria bacterium]|nr:hypothetical protein [Deltaproteobacteria bacterium]
MAHLRLSPWIVRAAFALLLSGCGSRFSQPSDEEMTLSVKGRCRDTGDIRHQIETESAARCRGRWYELGYDANAYRCHRGRFRAHVRGLCLHAY